MTNLIFLSLDKNKSLDQSICGQSNDSINEQNKIDDPKTQSHK